MNSLDPGKFTFLTYENIFSEILQQGYRAITLRDYFEGNFSGLEKILVNRIDVDVKFERLPRLKAIFARLGVKASIYVRLHAPGYNLLSFGNMAILRYLVEAGHEIGLHSEMSDAEEHCTIDGVKLLRRELDILETVAGTKIYGTASHGDLTGYNNLAFWQRHQPSDFGLLYEAYDPRLWNSCRYVSDSE